MTWRSRLMPSRCTSPIVPAIVIRPDRLGAVPRRVVAGTRSATRSSASSQEIGRNWPDALRAGAQQRLRQAVRVVDALGVARDLGADHAGGVAVRRRAAHRADARAVQHLHLESAGGRAVMRADGIADVALHGPEPSVRPAALAKWPRSRTGRHQHADPPPPAGRLDRNARGALCGRPRPCRHAEERRGDGASRSTTSSASTRRILRIHQQ